MEIALTSGSRLVVDANVDYRPAVLVNCPSGQFDRRDNDIWNVNPAQNEAQQPISFRTGPPSARSFPLGALLRLDMVADGFAIADPR